MKLLQPIELFQHCLKTNAPKQCRLLGLDVGNKYVGLAVSDPHNRTAAPLRYENTFLLISIFIQRHCHHCVQFLMFYWNLLLFTLVLEFTACCFCPMRAFPLPFLLLSYDDLI